MGIKRSFPHAKTLKFYETDVWGAYLSQRRKRFREQNVLMARINRRITTRKLTINPVKLRRKPYTVSSWEIMSSNRLKRFHHNIKEYQFRKIIVKTMRRPHIGGKYPKDFLAGDLESRLDVILFRSAFVPTVQLARQLINHKKVLVNNKVINKPSFRLLGGDILRIKKPFNFLVGNSFYIRNGVKKWRRKDVRGKKRLRSSYEKKVSPAKSSRRLPLKKHEFSSSLMIKRPRIAARVLALRYRVTARRLLKKKVQVFVKGAVKRSCDHITPGILRKGSFFSPYMWVSYARGEIVYGGKPEFESEVFYPFSLHLDTVITRYRSTY